MELNNKIDEILEKVFNCPLYNLEIQIHMNSLDIDSNNKELIIKAMKDYADYFKNFTSQKNNK